MNTNVDFHHLCSLFEPCLTHSKFTVVGDLAILLAFLFLSFRFVFYDCCLNSFIQPGRNCKCNCLFLKLYMYLVGGHLEQYAAWNAPLILYMLTMNCTYRSMLVPLMFQVHMQYKARKPWETGKLRRCDNLWRHFHQTNNAGATEKLDASGPIWKPWWRDCEMRSFTLKPTNMCPDKQCMRSCECTPHGIVQIGEYRDPKMLGRTCK